MIVDLPVLMVVLLVLVVDVVVVGVEGGIYPITFTPDI